jgi:hypothetical protein
VGVLPLFRAMQIFYLAYFILHPEWWTSSEGNKGVSRQQINPWLLHILTRILHQRKGNKHIGTFVCVCVCIRKSNDDISYWMNEKYFFSKMWAFVCVRGGRIIDPSQYYYNRLVNSEEKKYNTRDDRLSKKKCEKSSRRFLIGYTIGRKPR